MCKALPCRRSGFIGDLAVAQAKKPAANQRQAFLEVWGCPQASAVGGSTPKPGPFSFNSERKGGKEAPPGFHPWTPSAQPAGAKGWAAPRTATNQKRLAVLALFLITMRCTFAHNKVQGKQGYARPSPPQGEVGLPAVLCYRQWPLTVRAWKFGNAERRRGY